MNREQSEKFRDKHLIQKYNLIHLLPTLDVPELSGLYLKSFLNATKRYQLQLPPVISDSSSKFCGSCGTVRIPLRNTKMSIAENSNETKVECTRTLQYKCLSCKYTESFPLKQSAHQRIEPGSQAKDRFVATWPQRKQPEKERNMVEKKSSAKERAKKRKLNSLSNLLSRKKDEKKKQASPSLSLESFMQQD